MHAVFEALRHNAETRPDAIAFRDGARVLSWAGLAAQVAALAQALEDAPQVIGLASAGGLPFVVADLAVTLGGRRLVPLPPFFSREQQAHVLADAKVQAVIGLERAGAFGLPVIVLGDALLDRPDDVPLPRYAGGAQRVIYTSGSSGRPKGVVLGDRQLSASLDALVRVVRPGVGDRHLSVLPLAQLLEQTCGVFLPILAGAQTVFCPQATAALFGGSIMPLIEASQAVAPTTTLLAPALLAGWVAALEGSGGVAPAALRFVAVGGAATPPALLARAAAVGLPVCEGYGLSECCAVVAMNPPGEAVPGTVGQVLEGVDLRILDGEITVAGPTVMEGYLNAPAAPERWHTGDMGHFRDGRLVVEGRRDTLIVTPAGRNIAPEWVEARVNADPRVVTSALCLGPDGVLRLLLAVRAPLAPQELRALVQDLPAYAQPPEMVLCDPRHPGLLFPAGTPNRAVAADLAAAGPAIPLFTTAKVDC